MHASAADTDHAAAPSDGHDVVIIGAGLAGLAAAAAAHRAGARVQVLEASDGIGGRARTDEVDGFLLDRGFQVLLDAYPQVHAQLDVAALRLASFEPGAYVWKGRSMGSVRDPRRHPLSAPGTLLAGVATPRDAARLLALLRRITRVSDPYELLQGAAHDGAPELTARAAFTERYGFSPRLQERFFAPFFRGIMLDDELAGSSRMVEFVLRMLADGHAVLPERGLGALAQQLADRLPAGAVQLGARVAGVERGTVTLTDGRTIAARSVIVATDGRTSAQLLGQEWGIDEHVHATTLWFAAQRSPLDRRMLALNGAGASDGPVNEVCVPSDVQPSYAPAGQSLVGASCVGDVPAGDAELEAAVRRQLTTWFGADVAQWRLLRTDRIELALPSQRPPWLEERDWPVQVSDGLFVAGDHRDTASIDGALRSGARAGELAASA